MGSERRAQYRVQKTKNPTCRILPVFLPPVLHARDSGFAGRNIGRKSPVSGRVKAFWIKEKFGGKKVLTSFKNSSIFSPKFIQI
jgi:hypothetical protein